MKHILAISIMAFSMISYGRIVVTNETIITQCPTNSLISITNKVLTLESGLVITNFDKYALLKEAKDGKELREMTPEELANYRDVLLMTMQIEEDLGYVRGKVREPMTYSDDTAKIKVYEDTPESKLARPIKRYGKPTRKVK